MRFVNYATDAGPRAGLVDGDRVLDVADQPPGGLQALVAAGGLSGASAAGEVADAELLPPIHRPGGDPQRAFAISNCSAATGTWRRLPIRTCAATARDPLAAAGSMAINP